MLKPQINKMVKMYKNGLALDVLARTFEVSEGVVRTTLKNAGIEKPVFKHLTEAKKKEIVKQCKKGLTINELSEKFGYTGVTIRRVLKTSGVACAKKGRFKQDVGADTAKQIVDMYNSGYSTYAIAWKMSLAPHIVRVILEKNNVRMRKSTDYKLYRVEL